MRRAMNLINFSIARLTDEKLKVMMNVKKLYCEKTIMILTLANSDANFQTFAKKIAANTVKAFKICTVIS